MTSKEMKEFWSKRTLGEVRAEYNYAVDNCRKCKLELQSKAKELAELDIDDTKYDRKMKDLVSSISGTKSNIKYYEDEIKILKPIFDKKEEEGINQAEYDNYIKANKVNIDILVGKVEEMRDKALVEWDKAEWTEKDINELHDCMFKELIWMLRDNIGNVNKIHRIDYNNNRGFDGVFEGEKATVYINTILAGGYNIQKLHYRTLLAYN